MKNVILISLILLTIACGQKSKNSNSSEGDSLVAENQELKAKQAQRDSTSAQLVNAMNEIQANLDSIKTKENLIDVYRNGSDKSVQEDKNVKNKILNDIKAIYQLSRQNKAVITHLNKELKTNKQKSKAVEKDVEKMVAFLKEQIAEKDLEIGKLKNELAKFKIDMSSLNAKLDSVKKVDAALTEELQTAYYIVGTTHELKEQKILTKEGGFIGIGRVKSLTSDFNRSGFTKINIKQITKIHYPKEISKILTAHPVSSYGIVNNTSDNYIEVKNPTEFWSASKYLVVVVK